MKYSLVAFIFAVAVRAQTDISCAVSCLQDVILAQECKPRHFTCIITQCDAAVSLRKSDIISVSQSSDILMLFVQRPPCPQSRISVPPLTTKLPKSDAPDS